MAKAIFLRVLEPKPEEKGTALAAAVQAVREGNLDGRSAFAVDPSSFRQVPGAPFAYWVSDSLRRKLIDGSDGARARRQAERAVEQQEALLADIREFRERLARVAELHLVPNMDDGVVLNAAPLHELMPWPEPARYWRDLLQGKYDWSDIAGQIRERQGQGVKLA
jgi:hypothetical protein